LEFCTQAKGTDHTGGRKREGTNQHQRKRKIKKQSEKGRRKLGEEVSGEEERGGQQLFILRLISIPPLPPLANPKNPPPLPKRKNGSQASGGRK